MFDENKTREQLLSELTDLRLRADELEALEIEHKRTEEALKHSREWLTAIFEASRDGILVEENEIIIYVNKTYARLCGFDHPADLIGRHISIIISSDDNDRMLGFGKKRLQGEQAPSIYGFRAKRRDGSLVDLEASVSTASIADRNYIITVARDISERKRLEEQLHQSQKMEAIGQLAGGIAHDFNNLLMVIIGLSDVLVHKLDSVPKLNRHAEEIKKAGERAASLTHQLLAFSRRQLFQLETLDLNSTVSEMNGMLRRLIGEDIELNNSLLSSHPFVLADRSQIEQVILNLVVNARDAMPMGGKLLIETADVEVSARQVRRDFTIEPGRYVLLRVGDSGCGMDEQTLQRIFEPFFTTKEKSKGTGLGLSTVYGVVKQSGGYIEASSEQGRGSSFEIYLPKTDGVPVFSNISPAAVESVKVSETILLVEDETAVRELTSYLLKEIGYCVLEAEGASIALETCRNYKGVINLLITDVVMPMMNGRELAKRAKELRPEMAVLYMSGYVDKTIEILEEGTYFLEKPFSSTALLIKVRDALEK